MVLVGVDGLIWKVPVPALMLAVPGVSPSTIKLMLPLPVVATVLPLAKLRAGVVTVIEAPASVLVTLLPKLTALPPPVVVNVVA